MITETGKTLGATIDSSLQLLSRVVPTRTHLLQVLASGVSCKQEATLEALEEFTRGLKNNITALHAFYEEHRLNHKSYVSG